MNMTNTCQTSPIQGVDVEVKLTDILTQTLSVATQDTFIEYFVLFLFPTEMSTNFSFSVNSSSPSFSSSSSTSFYQLIVHCMDSSSTVVLLFFYTATNCILLLPLCLFVCFVAFQRWRQQTTSRTNRPTDLITYHQLLAELLSISGWIISILSLYTRLMGMIRVGIYLSSFGMQMNFHLLACVERYLAVVHPISYLRLKERHWILTRNIIIFWTWMISFGINFLLFMEKSVLISIITICAFVLIIANVLFCSISALSVLIRSRPGDRSGRREHVGKSKLRAFYSIMSIMAVLLVRLGGYILAISVYALSQLDETTVCGILLSAPWFCLPSVLVLPLLFLHRAGKLTCCFEKKKQVTTKRKV